MYYPSVEDRGDLFFGLKISKIKDKKLLKYIREAIWREEHPYY